MIRDNKIIATIQHSIEQNINYSTWFLVLNTVKIKFVTSKIHSLSDDVIMFTKLNKLTADI